MDDVQSGTVVELGVLQALGRIEFAVRHRRVVEHLGECPHHMFVVVKDLVVIAARTEMTLHEHLVRRIDHDLPHVVVLEQWGQRAVAREVAEGALGDETRIAQLERPRSSAELVLPSSELGVDQGPELCLTLVARDVQREVLRSRLHCSFDLDEGRVHIVDGAHLPSATSAIAPSSAHSLPHRELLAPGQNLRGPVA